MDNFGFGNWGDSNSPYQDSYGYSPNTTDDFDPPVFSKGYSKRKNDSYDFEISQDDSPIIPTRKEKTSTPTRYSGVRRSSIDDRAKEILQKAKSIKISADEEDNDRLKSYQDTFAELMDGLELPTDTKQNELEKTPKSAPSTGSPKAPKGKKRSDESLDSVTGDSFDISAADLEVGTFAERRAKEKASDRRRRMSLDHAPHSTTIHAKMAFSPEVVKSRRGRSGEGLGGGSFQMSSALSSIQRSNDEVKKGAEYSRYGSVERSDDDIYRMLNITGATQQSMNITGLSTKSGGNLENDSNDSSDLIESPVHGGFESRTNSFKLNRKTDSLTSFTQEDTGLEATVDTTPRLQRHGGKSFSSLDQLDSTEGTDYREDEYHSEEPSPAVKKTKKVDSHSADVDAEYSEDHEDEYSLDDFEQGSSLGSPAKSHNHSRLAETKTEITTGEKQNKGESAGKKGAAPVSVVEMKPAPVTAVDENVLAIMQRWSNPNSDFMKKSLAEVKAPMSEQQPVHPSATESKKVDTEPKPSPVDIIDTKAHETDQKEVEESSPNTNEPASIVTETKVTNVTKEDPISSAPPPVVVKEQEINAPAETPSKPSVSFFLSPDDTPATENPSHKKDPNNGSFGSSSSVLPGLNLLQAVGGASMVTSIPPSAPPTLETSYSAPPESFHSAAKPQEEARERAPIPMSLSQGAASQESLSLKPPTDLHTAEPTSRPVDNRSVTKSVSFQQMPERSNTDWRSEHHVISSSQSHLIPANDSIIDSKTKAQERSTSDYHSTAAHVSRQGLISTQGSASPVSPSKSAASRYDQSREADEYDNVHWVQQSAAASTLANIFSQYGAVAQRISAAAPQPVPLRYSHEIDSSPYAGTKFLSSSTAPVAKKPNAGKIAASTAAKIKHHKKQARPSHGTYSNLTKSAELRSKSSWQQRLAEKEEIERERQLKSENDRLKSKFRKLEQELQELRVSQLSDIEGEDVLLGDGEKTGGYSFERYSTRGKGGRPQSAPRAGAASHPSPGPTQNQQSSRLAWLDEVAVPASAPREEIWQKQAQEALRRIAEANSRLVERERAVQIRELTVSVREGELSFREDALELKERQVAATPKPKPPAPQREDSLGSRKVEVELNMLRGRERELLTEIDGLKAQLFSRNQDQDIAGNEEVRRNLGLKSGPNASLTSSAYVQRSEKFQDYKKRLTEAKTEDTGDHVTLPRLEYESLLKDHQEQERLIEGFQRENERLGEVVRALENEQAARKALFFEERAELNKELNRLRNAQRAAGGAPFFAQTGLEADQYRENHVVLSQGGDSVPVMAPVSSRKSVEVLRNELELEGQIRLLRERLVEAESGAGDREVELRDLVEKLRKDNRELVSQSAMRRSQHLDQDFLEVQAQNKVLEEEINGLKTKLNWYISNQGILVEAQQEVERVAAINGILKRELERRGLDGKAVLRLIESGGAQAPGDVETSVMDNKSVNSKGRGQRNFADVKRIKELEGVVRDLKESILKRNPDSVASLISAAAVSDSVQARRRETERKVRDLQQQLDDTTKQHDVKLRSLRQEHDRVKQRYEARIADLERTQREGTGESKDGSSTGKGRVRSSSTTVKTMTQAHNKISSLEEELERVRKFYTSKLEEAKRRYENQLRAMKRGDAPVQDQQPCTEEENPQKVKEETEKALSGTKSLLSSPEEQESETQKVNKERINRLEQELEIKTSEVQQLKSLLEDAERRINQVQTSSPMPADGTQTFDRRLEERLARVRLEIEKAELSERKKLQQHYEMRQQEERKNHQYEMAQCSERWEREREEMRKRVKEAEAQCQILRDEMIQATNKWKKEKPLTPEMTKFLQMESQLSQLEDRLHRRERELLAAVEDSKTVARLERARMQAIHDQECREKDDQLVRFQQELEQLVQALRHWQLLSGQNRPMKELIPGVEEITASE